MLKRDTSLADTPLVMEDANQGFKRRYPRRQFLSKVGVLTQGKYFIQNSFELGEKGMMFDTDYAFKQGDRIVCSFCLPDGYIVITQAQVRYQSQGPNSAVSKVGVEFTNINFEDRRKVRDFIAQRIDSNTTLLGIQ